MRSAPSRINIIPGTAVTVIDPRKEVLAFTDREVAQALCYSMRKNGARFLLGEKVDCPDRHSWDRSCNSLDLLPLVVFIVLCPVCDFTSVTGSCTSLNDVRANPLLLICSF